VLLLEVACLGGSVGGGAGFSGLTAELSTPPQPASDSNTEAKTSENTTRRMRPTFLKMCYGIGLAISPSRMPLIVLKVGTSIAEVNGRTEPSA
jgi:hypothetical protein